jgi:hypothetical protein
MNQGLKVAIIAGEVSGDLLGADLIAALKASYAGPVELIGVGGDALSAQGLQSLFDFSELSIMGITQVLARLPNLIRRINQTAAAIVAAKPDVLVIVDSPDFTHRVARKVRAALPPQCLGLEGISCQGDALLCRPRSCRPSVRAGSDAEAGGSADSVRRSPADQ